jgi:hypothetical protein
VGGVTEPVLGPAFSKLVAERQRADRLWGAMMLATTQDVCRSILLGRPVRVDTLEPAALRRALRGATPPPGSDYVTVTTEMLDAIDEPGGFRVVRKETP